MNSTITTPTSADTRHDAICRRAYELWQLADRPSGCDLTFWLHAESEMDGSPAGYGAGQPDTQPAPEAPAPAKLKSVPSGSPKAVSANSRQRQKVAG